MVAFETMLEVLLGQSFLQSNRFPRVVASGQTDNGRTVERRYISRIYLSMFVVIPFR
jgi:hypothetical protein